MNRERKSLLYYCNHVSLVVLSLLCLIPVLIVIAASLSTENRLVSEGFALWPRGLTLEAYTFAFQQADTMLRAYGVTVFITLFGTFTSLLISSLFAYAISRRDFAYRNSFSFIIFFTMLFNGGLVPTYIVMTNVLHLKDTLWALIVPLLVSAWNILIMRTFFSQNPQAIIEAAKIEGAGEYRLFFQIIIPMSTPVLATIGIITVLGYWNDWFNALLYIDNRSLLPLQYLVYNMVANAQMMKELSNSAGASLVTAIPTKSLQMAVVMIVITPMTVIYLYFKRYFVRGLTIGALKG
ncbi:sugar ABC transporter permease [Paenibacillus sp. 598K]|uniref:carbohydrate ABC transporter permease n=1 Tax=Paenibacillus sp. 598K TaxID=1117987 RepID=UPI000FFADA3C|nr:carbohydrate ABC transporter permease [Paenibacillus sp. 598K]GBF77779.1 sugar ABC transporter permease [Paenibacillus sp. 598K]